MEIEYLVPPEYMMVKRGDEVITVAAGFSTTVTPMMMNLQELQTVVTNRLPIKLFLINNCGYHSIRITQNNLFNDKKKVGIGEESGDLGFL